MWKMIGLQPPAPELPLRTALAPLRLAFLALATLVYGLFSAPAPPGFGSAELVIAFAGLCAVGVTRPLLLATGRPLAADERLEVVGCLAFVLLLWPPLVQGLLKGRDQIDILRDVVPLGFLFLPLLLHDVLRRAGPGAPDVLAAALAMAGVAFAARWWIDSGGSVRGIGRAVHGDGDLYLLNSATVAFAAVWLTLKGVPSLSAGLRSLPAGVAALGGSLLCLGAMTAAVHRGGLALTGAALAVAFVVWASAKPFRSAFAVAVATIMLVVWGASVDGVIGLLLAKTDAVGLNRRGAEFLAVLQQVTTAPDVFLFGQGWGALLPNPAVGGWAVSFTHSAPSYFLLKGGTVGLCAFLLYLAALAPLLRDAAIRRPDLLLACLPPLVSGLMLHTSYKYMCFGLCLCILTAAARRGDGSNG